MDGMMTKRMALTVSLAVFGLPALSSAELIGIDAELQLPIVVFDTQGETVYDAGTGLFSVDALPLAIRFFDGGPVLLVTPTGIPPTEAVSIRLEVNELGTLIGGVPRDDLIVVGEVDEDGDGNADYQGILLTGEVAAFGFEDTGGTTDLFDFRFRVTGGELASLYVDRHIGAVLTSTSSDFMGDFGVSFEGDAKGDIGAVEPFCGDGILDPGEECDDGNQLPDDGCSPTCEIEETGGEGCTPGFWKQPHHLAAWVGYHPDELFDVVFGVDAPGDLTLLETLWQRGGKEKALGRHAVAALLDAASPDVNYYYTAADVIALVQSAYATDDFEGVKNLLEHENESGCPLSLGREDHGDQGKPPRRAESRSASVEPSQPPVDG
jgi:cysteine-rich repeat protein